MIALLVSLFPADLAQAQGAQGFVHPGREYFDEYIEFIDRVPPDSVDVWPRHEQMITDAFALANRIAQSQGPCDWQHHIGNALAYPWDSPRLDEYRGLMKVLPSVVRQMAPLDENSVYLRPRRATWRREPGAGVPTILLSYPIGEHHLGFGELATFTVALRQSVVADGWGSSMDILEIALVMGPFMANRHVDGHLDFQLRDITSLLREIRELSLEHPPSPAEARAINALLAAHSRPVVSDHFLFRTHQLLLEESLDELFDPGGARFEFVSRLPDLLKASEWLPGGWDIRAIPGFAMHGPVASDDVTTAMADLHEVMSMAPTELADEFWWTHTDICSEHYTAWSADRARFAGCLIDTRNQRLKVLELQNELKGTRIAVLLSAYVLEHGDPPLSLADLDLEPQDLLTVQDTPFVYTTDETFIKARYEAELSRPHPQDFGFGGRAIPDGRPPSTPPPMSYSVRAQCLEEYGFPVVHGMKEYVTPRYPWPDPPKKFWRQMELHEGGLLIQSITIEGD